MFWGGISGRFGKGPGLFWEKGWGTINSRSYCEHIVPLIADYVRRGGLIFIQDNTGGHIARDTLAFMREQGLIPIFWPALSPDLNPIETLWDRIKDIIKQKDPEIYRSYPRLRTAIIEAWNSITDEKIRALIGTMYDRCQAVIDADGWHTKY
jgi:transposase